MCQTSSVIFKGHHCNARPRLSPLDGTVTYISRIAWPFALQTPKLIVAPAQFLISVAKRLGSPLSRFRPLIPMIKSNQGSRARLLFVLRRTWKPKPDVLARDAGFCASAGEESRRAMKRLRVPNRF